MKITGTHFNYYQICKRKLWLFANSINFEHTSDQVYEGRLIHDDSYPQRSSKYEEIEMDGIKVDFYEQLKYYIYVFEKNGITGVSGVLEYPTLRKTKEVFLSKLDIAVIEDMKSEINQVVSSDECPPLQKKGICKNCSYYEFCYSREEEE